jgi:hypothetical protein
MTKQQAAQTLGVTVRTVERYLTAGKLPYTQRKIDDRVIDDIDDDEVHALKAARDVAAAEREQRVVPPTVMQHVSFRVEPEYLQVLEIEAARRQLKRTEYARQIFCHALTEKQIQQAQLEELRDDVQRLNHGVDELRRGMVEMFFQLLVQVCKIKETEAEEWIREVFRT